MAVDDATRARLAVRSQIISCAACALRSEATRPVPFSGPAPAKIAVVGEAPGKVEDRDGRPFWGPAGQLARRWLVVSGIDLAEVAWVNVCCCWPSKTKTPKREHVDACSANLIAQLGLIDPSYVLVLGATALRAYHPTLQISKARGHWWVGGGRWHMASYHPSYILRGNTEAEGLVLKDLEYFRFHSLGVFDPPEGQTCVQCWRDAEWWRDLLGYCRWHKPALKEETVKVGRTKISKSQGQLL